MQCLVIYSTDCNKLRLQNPDQNHFVFTLVKVHPGKKLSTMIIEMTMMRNSTHTTMVRVEGREHDLKTRRVAHHLPLT